MADELGLSLRWLKTSSDHAADFCVDSPIEGATIGRIMLVVDGPKKRPVAMDISSRDPWVVVDRP